MRVLVATEHRFSIAPDGVVYPSWEMDYSFLRRYLDVFDHVTVLARVGQIDNPPPNRTPSTGPGVSFLPLPDYRGPWQHLKHLSQLRALAADALNAAEAHILRVPGIVGSLLWSQAVKANRPYAVEVIGDPWDCFGPGSVKTVVRPFVRIKARRDMLRQCRLACAASYVTEYGLQKRYPPGAWSAHYSSIELPGDAIISETAVQTRIQRTRTKSSQNESWRLCYAGTMAQLYKSPDVLIQAVATCIRNNLDVELTMLGDGRFRPQLEDQARRLGVQDRIKFVGQVPPGKAVYDHLGRADIYVLPSRQEGLPRSLIEAMARGLPCIASNVGGIPELMEPWYMVPPNDADALAQKIAALLSDVERRTKAIPRNVQIASGYRSDLLQHKRVEFYKKVEEETRRVLVECQH